jgi:hypothetical protein
MRYGQCRGANHRRADSFERAHHKEKKVAMNEFQLTLTNYAARQAMSISELAKCAGYDLLLFESIVTGKTRQMPANFFIRVGDVLNLTTGEKDALVRSWAFGVERWNWPQSDESHQRKPAKRRAG